MYASRNMHMAQKKVLHTQTQTDLILLFALDMERHMSGNSLSSHDIKSSAAQHRERVMRALRVADLTQLRMTYLKT